MDLFIKYFLPDQDKSVYRRVFQLAVELPNGRESQLFAYITMESDVDFSYLSNVANFTWNSILDTYSEYEGATLQAVKRSLRSGIQKAQEVLKNNQEIVDKGIDFEVTILALVEGNMYISFVGDHQVTIFRDETSNPVSALLREHKVNAGSIAVYPTDVIAVTDDDHEYTWDAPVSLFTEIEESVDEDTLDMGVIFMSETVDFEDLIAVDPETSPYDLLNSGEETLEPVESENSIDTDESANNITNPQNDLERASDTKIKEEYLKNSLLDQDAMKKNDSEKVVGILESSETFEISETSKSIVPPENSENTKNTQENKSEFEKDQTPIQKTLSILKIIWEFIKKWSKKIWVGLNTLIEKLSVLWGNITEYILALLANLFGNKPWYKRLVANFSQSQLGKSPKLGKIEVGGYKTKQMQNKRGVIVILALVGVIVVFIGVNKTKQAKEIAAIHESYIAYEDTVSKYLDTAEGLLRSDEAKAISSLAKASELLENPTIDVSVISAMDSEAKVALEDRLVSIEDSLYNRVAIVEDQNLTKFIDGRLKLGPDTQPTDIAIYRDPTSTEYIYVTDKGEKTLFWINTASSKIQQASEGAVQLGSPTYVDIGNNGVLLYDTEIGGVRAQFDGNKGNLQELELLSGTSPDDYNLSSVDEMAILGGGDDMYLLSATDQAIMKAKGNGSTSYNLPYTFYSTDSFSSATDFYADNNLEYVLSAGSSGFNVYQYLQLEGRLGEYSFQMNSPKVPIQDLTAGYTNGKEGMKMYFFDREGKRILVYEKPTGSSTQFSFVKEYVYRGDDQSILENVADIVVDATQTFVYILDGSNIWKLSL